MTNIPADLLEFEDPELSVLGRRLEKRIDELKSAKPSSADMIDDAANVAVQLRRLLHHISDAVGDTKEYGIFVLAEQVADDLVERLSCIEAVVRREQETGER